MPGRDLKKREGAGEKKRGRGRKIVRWRHSHSGGGKTEAITSRGRGFRRSRSSFLRRTGNSTKFGGGKERRVHRVGKKKGQTEGREAKKSKLPCRGSMD